jgi:hypothetical protein
MAAKAVTLALAAFIKRPQFEKNRRCKDQGYSLHQNLSNKKPVIIEPEPLAYSGKFLIMALFIGMGAMLYSPP